MRYFARLGTICAILKNVKNTHGGGLISNSKFLVVLICFILPIAKSFLMVTDLFYVRICDRGYIRNKCVFFNCLAFYVFTYI